MQHSKADKSFGNIVNPVSADATYEHSTSYNSDLDSTNDSDSEEEY